MSLKIAYITSTFPDYEKCGTGIYAGYLTRSLGELNHDVHVITTALTEIKNTMPRVQIHKVMQNWGLTEAPRLIQTLMQIKPQIIHINHPTVIAGAKSKFLVNLFPEISHTLSKTKVVTTLHEFVNNSLLGKIKVLPMVLGSDVVTVTNSFYKEKLKKYMPEEMHKKIEVVDVGSNFDSSIRSTVTRIEARKRWNLSDEDKVLGFSGFITPPKGFHHLVEVLAELLKADSNYKILALSSWNLTDGAYKHQIMQAIRKHGLQDKIIFSGFLSDQQLWENMAAPDLFVFPFSYPVEERSSGVLRQALQKGAPTIVYAKDLSYNEFGLINGENILFSPFNDPEKMARQISQFFQDPSMAPKLSQGSKVFQNLFSFENVANQMSRIYSRLV